MFITPIPAFMPTAGGGAWTPASLGAALIAWYKADAGVYNDAGTTVATDGQSVQQWNDQSGNGINLSQATAGLRPVYHSSGFNSSHPGITFTNANNQRLQTATNALSLGTTTLSGFLVVNFTSSSPNLSRLLTFLGSGQAATYDNTPSAILSFLSFGGTYNLRALRNSVTLQSGTTVSVNTNYRIGSIFDGANNTIYVNNVAGTSNAATGTFAATGTLGVADDPGGATPLDGTIAEVVITNSAISSGDRSSLDSYFVSKWGL